MADFQRNLWGSKPATTEAINEIVRGSAILKIRDQKLIDPDHGGEGVWIDLLRGDSLVFIAKPTVPDPLWEVHYDATGTPAARLDLALVGLLGASVMDFAAICQRVRRVPMVGIRPARFEDTTGGEVRRLDLGDGDALVFHARAPGPGMIVTPGAPRATATVQPFLMAQRRTRLKI